MSVIIKGINKPSGCNTTCPCKDGESGFCDAAYIKYGDYKHINEDYDNVPNNCPIIPLEELKEEISRLVFTQLNGREWIERAEVLAIINQYMES